MIESNPFSLEDYQKSDERLAGCILSGMRRCVALPSNCGLLAPPTNLFESLEF